MRRLVVKPEGWPCTLKECPPGLFYHQNCLGLKTEYSPIKSTGDNPQNMEYVMDVTDVEVYVVASGESFWGGVSSKEDRLNLIVQPCSYQWEEVDE